MYLLLFGVRRCGTDNSSDRGLWHADKSLGYESHYWTDKKQPGTIIVLIHTYDVFSAVENSCIKHLSLYGKPEDIS